MTDLSLHPDAPSTVTRRDPCTTARHPVEHPRHAGGRLSVAREPGPPLGALSQTLESIKNPDELIANSTARPRPGMDKPDLAILARVGQARWDATVKAHGRQEDEARLTSH